MQIVIKNELKSSNSFRYAIIILLMLSLVSACDFSRPKKIALSKAIGSVHYEAYTKWIKSNSEDYECINLYNLPIDEAVELLDDCSGIVLTGGPDVHPSYYGKGYDTARCSIDIYRDSLEFKLIQEALDMKLPILAICRGEQILNVHLGGTLIVDIPQDFDSLVTHRCENPEECMHQIEIVDGTKLSKLATDTYELVNTNHHQAVDKLAPGLKVTARSCDGLIEAYEWAEPDTKPWLIAVQWHPERMGDGCELSKNIVTEFIEKVEQYRTKPQ